MIRYDVTGLRIQIEFSYLVVRVMKSEVLATYQTCGNIV